MTTPSIAAGTYANVARLGDAAAGLGKGVAGAAGEAGNGSFGAMLKDVLGQVVETGQKSDAQTRAIRVVSLCAGQGRDVIDVVTAVSETEVAVETLVAVRNKVIEAYQSIMSMPI